MLKLTQEKRNKSKQKKLYLKLIRRTLLWQPCQFPWSSFLVDVLNGWGWYGKDMDKSKLQENKGKEIWLTKTLSLRELEGINVILFIEMSECKLSFLSMPIPTE